MADPVGIIGTAIGLVSFGLQLYTTIDEYVRAVEGRDNDLATASQIAEYMIKQVQSIVDTMAKLPADYDGHATDISSILQEWQTERQSLVNILAKLRPKAAGWKKAKATVFYPFGCKDLVEAQKRLGSLINRLSLTLQVLDMLVLLFSYTKIPI